MENATDALKIAAAVLIFVGALSLAILGLTRAQQAATSVLGNSDNQDYYNTDNINILKNRAVGIETVIPTLYSYFKEGYTILFYTGTANENNELISDIRPITLYYSESLPSRLARSNLLNQYDSYGSLPYNGQSYPRAIYGFDANDEETRQEPWLHDELHEKLFIQSFINNTPDISTYDMSRPSSVHYNKLENNKLTLNFDEFDGLTRKLGTGSLSTATDALFIERIGVYNLVTNEGSTTTSEDGSVIELSNNEIVPNEEGTQKRVIQYIYIGNRKR